VTQYDGTYARPGDLVDSVIIGAPTGRADFTLAYTNVDTAVVVAATGALTELGGGAYRWRGPAPAVGVWLRKWTIPAVGTYDDPELLIVTAVGVSLDAPYFTVDELRERYSELTVAKYSDEKIEEYRAYAEREIEKACNQAFVPRTHTETVHGRGRDTLRLTRQPVREITAVTIDGTYEYSAGDLADLRVAGIDRVWGRSLWPRGYANIEISYTYGQDEPPAEIKLAAMALARDLVVTGPVSDRKMQAPTQDGGAVNLATPGLRGALFGIPAVDAAVDANTIWPVA
jgi:hypothetical protein